jgi:hypothetical protein
VVAPLWYLLTVIRALVSATEISKRVHGRGAYPPLFMPIATSRSPGNAVFTMLGTLNCGRLMEMEQIENNLPQIR